MCGLELDNVEFPDNGHSHMKRPVVIIINIRMNFTFQWASFDVSLDNQIPES